MATSRRTVRYLLLVVVLLLIYQAYRPHERARRLFLVRSSYQWSSNPLYHPPNSTTSLPTGKPKRLPRIQHRFPPQSRVEDAILEPRRQAVKAVFQRCWSNYREQAWLRDELKPVTGGARDTFGGWAATLVDSLDTLWIMDLKDDYYEAVGAAITLDWANTTETAINMFETNIRHLGGLLAAYDLSRDKAILEKATELGDMLFAGFDTPNRMPGFWLNFANAKQGKQFADQHEASASPCSLSLEFTRLSQLTGNPKYYDAISRVTAALDESQNSTKLPGMWPKFVDMEHLSFQQDFTFTLGASADSLYEYLPKMYALLGGLEPVYQKLFEGAAQPIIDHLLFRPMLPESNDVLFPGTAVVGYDNMTTLSPEVQHLGCFVGGMFGLAGRLYENEEWVNIGIKATKGCVYAYSIFPHGVMPEIFDAVACESVDYCTWDEELWTNTSYLSSIPGIPIVRDGRYILRPEAIESVFLLYRITGRKEFQDAAWEMFVAITELTETKYGHSAVVDVTVPKEQILPLDSMESFWMSETLKYFYLIFSPPELISLDEYVFNTEAHPLKRPR